MTNKLQTAIFRQIIRFDWPLIGLIALITLTGFSLRIWGIGWSLPDARHPLATYHPDELVNLEAARAADIPHGQFDIKFYNYGAFYFYLVSAAQSFAQAYGFVPQLPAATLDKPPATILEQLALIGPQQASLFLIGRLVTVALGTATIPILFLLGLRVYGRSSGLFAALLYAVAPLAVVHAHFLTVDVPLTFFVTLTLLMTEKILSKAHWRDYAIAGACVGLAAATKYSGILVLAAPLVAHFIRPYRNLEESVNIKSSSMSPDAEIPTINRDDLNDSTASDLKTAEESTESPDDATPASGHIKEAPSPIQKVLILAGITALTFLIACPGIWMNWPVFWDGTYPGSGVRYELFEHAKSGHGNLFVDTGLGWWYHLGISLRFGLGDPLLLLSLSGVGYAAYRAIRSIKNLSKNRLEALDSIWSSDTFLLAFLLLFYFVAGLSAVRFARYLLPVYPVLCLFAGRVVVKISARWRKLTFAIGIVVALAAGLYSFSLVLVMASRDARDLAADSLEKYGKVGATIAFARIPWFQSPPLSPLFAAQSAPIRMESAKTTTRFHLLIPAHEWDVSVLNAAPDYVILSNYEMMHEVERLHQPLPVAFVATLRKSYKPVKFTHAAVVGLPNAGPLIPEDLLYILPEITVFKKM